MLYLVSADVIYSEEIEAETEEEAIREFEANCSYGITSEIECECIGEKEEDETDSFRAKYGFDF